MRTPLSTSMPRALPWLLCVVCAAWTGVRAEPPGAPARSAAGAAKLAGNGVAKGVSTSVAPARFVREFGGISEYRLANGLQLLLFPDDAQSTTTVDITYRVGSRHEAPGEFGMAHLLEHLMFKGTPSHGGISDAFERRGLRFNAETLPDVTHYVSSFNADPASLDFVLGLEADRMVNSFIAKADLDTEMTVVRNEYEAGENDPMTVLNKRVAAVAYDWHNYGHHPIGPKSDIEQVPIERLQAFYRRYYRPDNAMLMVAGRFDAQTVLARVTRLFGPLKAPPTPIPKPYTVEPAQDGERTVVVRRVGGQPALMVHYHVPAITHPDSAPLLVLGMLLSADPGGQLHRELVDSKLALAAGLSGLGGADPGGVQAFAVLPPGGDQAAVEARLLDIVEGRTGTPFDEVELARVRARTLASYREQMTRPSGLVQQIAQAGASDWRLQFRLMDDIAAVTLDDVERVRKAYLRPANRTVGRYVPAEQAERVEIPAAPPLAPRLADLKAPPQVEEGERFDPTPERLAARTQTRRLPSGIDLITLGKRTRGEQVALQMQLRWGDRAETFRHRGTAVIADLMGEGSVSMSRQALQDRVIALRASMRIVSGDQGATLSIGAERDHLLEVLALAADLIQHPLLPEQALVRMKDTAIAGLEGSRQELEALRRAATREHYNRARGLTRGQPGYERSLDEQIAEVRATTLADVTRFHADYWSANDARVSVVGAIPDGLDAAVERLFGAWKKPSAPPFVRPHDKAAVIPPTRIDVIARDKTGAAMVMRVDFALNDRDPDEVPLAIATHVFGGAAMESRLSRRIRQQAGLSYGVGASLSVAHFGEDANLTIGGIFSPPDRERMLALVREELARMTRDGITASELERAKRDLLEARRQALADDGVLVAMLSAQADRGETWAQAAQLDAAIQAATIEQVNQAWRRRIRLDGFVVSTVGDFKDTP